MTQSVVLIRHGETEWSRDGRHTSHTDVELTREGRREARSLAAELARWSFAAVLCSPLRRARETCELAGLDRGAVRYEADLREWDYGDYEGLTTPGVHRTRPGWLLWRDGVPGGETVEDVGARADRVLAGVRAVDGDAALVGHGHCLRIMAARWIGLPPREGARLALDPASISVLGHEHEMPVLRTWNVVIGQRHPGG